jgi:hypothetical protein
MGRGRAIGRDSSGFLNKLLSGWSVTPFMTLASGEPNNLPANVFLLGDPRASGADWNGTVDWKRHQIVGWSPCVLRQFNDGTIRPQQFSINRGCGTDPSNYAWLMVANYAPGGGVVPGRLTPFRSGQIRKQMLFNIDMGISKMTDITEKLKVQFRVEAFNLTNYYYFGRDSHFNVNPNDPNFGTIFPHLAWIGNGYPRQVQLGFKVLW